MEEKVKDATEMIDTTGKPEEKKAEVLEDEMDEYADLRMQEML